MTTNNNIANTILITCPQCVFTIEFPVNDEEQFQELMNKHEKYFHKCSSHNYKHLFFHKICLNCSEIKIYSKFTNKILGWIFIIIIFVILGAAL